MNKVNIIREKSDKKKRTYLPVKYIIEFLLLYMYIHRHTLYLIDSL